MVEVLHCDRCGVRIPMDRPQGAPCGNCGYVPEANPLEDAGRGRSSARASSARHGASRKGGARAQPDAAGRNAALFAVAVAAGLSVPIAVAVLLGGGSESPPPDSVPAARPAPAPAVPVPRAPAEPVPAPAPVARAPAPASGPAPSAPPAAPITFGGGGDDGFFAKLRAESEERRAGIIGGWTPAGMSVTWNPMEWDITARLRKPGKLEITFSYVRGAHRLDMQWAALLEDGREVSRDEHHGFTGDLQDRNTYVLDLPGLKAGARYVLRANVRSDGGTDSTGDVRLRALPAGE